jgi:hypothetical protein
MLVSNRNSIKALFARPEHGYSYKKHILSIILRSISENSYTGVLLKMPVLLLLIGTLFLKEGGVDQSLLSPIWAALAVYFIVNLPPFLFLGEAERYLNHVAFFIVAATVSVTIPNHLEMIFVLILYGMIFLLLERFLLVKMFETNDKEKVQVENDMISYLQSLNEKVVLCYPYNAVGLWRILLQTPHKVIRSMTGNESYDNDFEKKYEDDYPYVKLETLDSMAKDLGLNIFIASKKSLETRQGDDWAPSALWEKLDFGGNVYDVYQNKQAKI